MPRFDLARHRDLLLQDVLPRYGALGRLAFAYLQGSLASGYTDSADLDIITVWNDPEVPTDRTGVVAALDERKPAAPSVVDYRDIHLDRFVLAGQEYNVGHHALADFREMVGAALDGRELPGERVLGPLVLVSGFRSAVLLTDPAQLGSELQAAVAAFPPRLQAQAQHVVRNRKATMLAQLTTLAEREDWFAFTSALITATHTALQALFAAHAVYYPGDKWLRQAMLRFGLPPQAIAAFDTIVAPATIPKERIAALGALVQLADPPNAAS